MDKQNELGPAGRLFFGALLIVGGMVPVLGAFDIGPLEPRDINGPPWLAVVAGGVFVAGGLALLLGRAGTVVNMLLVVLVTAGLAALGNWIAFGAGERSCTGTLPLLGGRSELSGWACRVPFGIGALIVDAILLYVAAVLLRRLLGGPPRLARLVRASEVLVMISLAPILLPMLLFLIGRSLFEVVKIRLSTGAWPRNEAFIRRRRGKAAAGDPPERP